MPEDAEIMRILREAKKLAQRYHSLTGKPLGITGEVAEYEAARYLELNLHRHVRPDMTQSRRLVEPYAACR